MNDYRTGPDGTDRELWQYEDIIREIGDLAGCELVDKNVSWSPGVPVARASNGNCLLLTAGVVEFQHGGVYVGEGILSIRWQVFDTSGHELTWLRQVSTGNANDMLDVIAQAAADVKSA